MLKVNGIDVYYGRVKALREVSIDVKEGELVSLLGANGAGKTTLLMTISGIIKPTAGTVDFLETRIDKLGAYKIVSLGISHIPQGRQLFSDMTVLENLEIGAYPQTNNNVKKQEMEKIFGYFGVLAERKNQRASTLSGGEQQMLAIARGLMSKPKLLLLDEPSIGLAPLIVEHLSQIIMELYKRGMTILLVEQNIWLALELTSRAFVLENGSITAGGMTHDILQSNLIKKAYLGL